LERDSVGVEAQKQHTQQQYALHYYKLAVIERCEVGKVLDRRVECSVGRLGGRGKLEFGILRFVVYADLKCKISNFHMGNRVFVESKALD